MIDNKHDDDGAAMTEDAGCSTDIQNKRQDTRKLVKRAERDAWNRLLSIIKDADWVARFCKDELDNQWLVIANLRCGAWYIPPFSQDPTNHAKTIKGCYFKSTDGHTHEWSFSLKRYNLELLQLIKQQGGCVIVDSTRRGKSMPDALSKTVPIWCAVINAAVQQRYVSNSSAHEQYSQLHTPQHIVSASEHAQIEGKIGEWADELLASDLELPRLKKPLYPLFVTRDHHDEALRDLNEAQQESLPFHPLVLISASEKVPTPSLQPIKEHFEEHLAIALPDDIQTALRKASFVYVQGSGDDEEAWAHGLTPQVFWQDETLRDVLDTGGDADKLVGLLQSIVLRAKVASMSIDRMRFDRRIHSVLGRDVQIGALPLWLGTRDTKHKFARQDKSAYGAILHLDGQQVMPSVDAKDKDDEGSSFVHTFAIERGKRGLNTFREALFTCASFARETLPQPMLICSAEDGIGGDLRIGVAICILAACFDADRNVVPRLEDSNAPLLSKNDVRRRLQWITSAVPSAKPPSRAHMLRINEVLISGAHRPRTAAD